MWDDDQIDAAIDEAARELTVGDPGSEFRVRVMERIERAPRFALAWRPVAVGVAVAAIAAIALMVRPTPNPTHDNKPDATEVRLPPSPENGFGEPRKPDNPSDSNPPSPRAADVRRPPSPENGFGEPRKPDAPYLSDIAPLTTAPLDLESIAVPALTADESLHIDPLPSAPSIAVAPLAAEPEGDRR
jgi:hypothetical protein